MLTVAKLCTPRNLLQFKHVIKNMPMDKSLVRFCTRVPAKPTITVSTVVETPDINYGLSNRQLPGQIREKSSKCSPSCTCGPKKSKKKSASKLLSRCGKSKRKLPDGGIGSKKAKSTWWRYLSFATIPMILLFSVFVFSSREPHERPPFVKYEYMRKRDKRFAWGDGIKTFFHNPHVNALPDGYEDDLERKAREEEEKELQNKKGKK